MYKYLTIFLFIFLSVLLCGCIDIAQEIWINNDGSGRLDTVLLVDEALIDVDVKNIISDSFNNNYNSLSTNEDIKIIEHNSYSKDGIHFFIDRIETDDLVWLLSINSSEINDLSLVSFSNGNIVFSEQIFVAEQKANEFVKNEIEKLEPSSNDIGNLLLKSALENHYWTIFVHTNMPIFNTNGKYVDKTKQTVRWQIPMGDVFINHKMIKMSLEAGEPTDQSTLSKKTQSASVSMVIYSVIIGAAASMGISTIFTIILFHNHKKKLHESIHK